MSDRKDKKREAPISYRPPKDLRDEFHSRVQKSGLSTSAFLTKAVFNQAPPRQSRRPSIEEKLATKLTAQLAYIRDQLDETSRVHGDAALYDERFDLAFEALIEMRNAFFEATGRKP